VLENTEERAAAESLMAQGIGKTLVQLIADPYSTIQERRLATQIVAYASSCSGTATSGLVDLGVISALVHLCKTSNNDVDTLENAVWALGNIAGESDDLLLQLLLAAGMVDVLLDLLAAFPDELNLTRTCLWSASNLTRRCRLVKESLPQLIKLGRVTPPFLRSLNVKIVKYALATLVPLCGPCPRDLVRVPNLVEAVVSCLQCQGKVLLLALRACVSFLASYDDVADFFVEANVTEYLVPLLHHQEDEILQLVCFAMANICTGTSVQIHRFLLSSALDTLLATLHDPRSCSASILGEMKWGIGHLLVGCASEDLHLIFARPHFLSALRSLISEQNDEVQTNGITGALRLCEWTNDLFAVWDEANPFIDVLADLRQIIAGFTGTDAHAEILHETYLGAPRHPSSEWLTLESGR
jgi:hypothetical protein